MTNFIPRALAQFIPPQSDFSQPAVSISGTSDLITKVNTIVSWVFYGLVAWAIIEIILAGFGFISAKGDPKALVPAKNRVVFAAVAIGVAILAKSVPYIVKSFLQS